MKSPVTHRSISIDGRKTSINLECPFWSLLKEIAQAQGATVSQTVKEIDRVRRGPNLSSAIRQFVLDRVRNGTGLTEFMSHSASATDPRNQM
jgi:predicted DNA-binding ribbon-helix-helix protein